MQVCGVQLMWGTWRGDGWVIGLGFQKRVNCVHYTVYTLCTVQPCVNVKVSVEGGVSVHTILDISAHLKQV